MEKSIIALFCCLADFVKIYEVWCSHSLLPDGKIRHREGRMCLAELLTIAILFHASPCRNFKFYYNSWLAPCWKHLFPDLISYSRFVQLMPRLFVPLCVLMQSLSGQKTGIYIADSTTLGVCHPKRITRNKVFAGLAERGKSTMGWFYGFKLHIVINDLGDIVAVKITKGNVDDRAPLPGMVKTLKGILLADKGYIGKKLFAELYRWGLKLITGIRANMRNYLMPLMDKLLLRKRFIVETIFDKLKNDLHLWHTRHRSAQHAFTHLFAALVAYQLSPSKPSLKRMPLIQS